MEAGRSIVSTTYDFYQRGIIVDSVVSGDYPIMNALSKHIFQYIKSNRPNFVHPQNYKGTNNNETGKH